MADNPYAINYDNEQFKEVEADKKAALSENEKLYSGIVNNTDKYYQAQIDASKDWQKTQTNLQNEQTDFAIEKIEQEKDQAKKDYTKEQSGAYQDWQKQKNAYGVNAEQQAANGMQNSGFSESSQVSLYNTYQNRVSKARESYNLAVLNYNNSIKDARLQNNSALAEIAYQALQKQLELSLQGFQYKNTLLLDQASKKLELEKMYQDRWQNVLAQINTENALAENIRQYNQTFEEDKRQFEEQLKIQKEQLAIQRASLNSGGGRGYGGYSGSSSTEFGYKGVKTNSTKSTSSKNSSSGTKINKGKSSSSSSNSFLPRETSQSILNLGGPYSASYVDKLVQSGNVIETKSKSGNTVFVKSSKTSSSKSSSKKSGVSTPSIFKNSIYNRF